MTEGECEGCGRRAVLTPLHGPEKGGPLRCYVCAGVWQAKQTQKRRTGRVAFRALKAFIEAGGTVKEINSLSVAALPFGSYLIGGDFARRLTSGLISDMASDDDTTVLTSELLADVLRLTHPDAHPPERRDLANRVTQQLLALQPFVFPAMKPKPPPKPRRSRNGSSKEAETLNEPSRPPFPCDDCASTYPLNYCTACRAEWDKRQREEDERERAKHRKWYAKRTAINKCLTCFACGKTIKGNRRKDTRYCSNACRQRAHRKAARQPEAEVGG